MLSLASESAWAHAILVESNPREGSFVTGPDLTAVLSFNSRIDQSRSRLSLDGPGLSAYPVPVNRDDTEPTKLVAALHHLNTGIYTMHWQVLAADGHITRGTISFRVK
jgi:methionine-rich copper-binding protein CopC